MGAANVEPAPLMVPELLDDEPDQPDEPPLGAGALEFELDPHAAITSAAPIAMATAPRLRFLTGSSP